MDRQAGSSRLKHPEGRLSRRDFLKLVAIGAGLAAASCRPGWLEEPHTPAFPQPAGKAATRPTVALALATGYERISLRPKIQDLIEAAGGLQDLVRPGDRVALKVNLTGGLHFNPPSGYTAPESYVTHPEVVRTLGELVIDAGARQVFIVEALYDRESPSAWGFEQVAADLGASIVDLNAPAPYPDFTSIPTGPGWLVYESFWLNPILQEVDALISVAKMKCHFNCGITLAMKNLIGLVPVSRYRLEEAHWWRSALHGAPNETRTRLPRVILDLNRAAPVHFALVDGVMTAEGGESPRGSFRPVQPGLLAAGRVPVAVDAVVTAAMGFDPLAEPPDPPFLRSDNYLSLARNLGLGTNLLSEIEVVGASLEDIEIPFIPAWEM